MPRSLTVPIFDGTSFGSNESKMTEKSARRFPELLHVRCPEALPALIERGAERLCVTPSEYIRRSIFERLKKDGLNPSGVGVPVRSD